MSEFQRSGEYQYPGSIESEVLHLAEVIGLVNDLSLRNGLEGHYTEYVMAMSNLAENALERVSREEIEKVLRDSVPPVPPEESRAFRQWTEQICLGPLRVLAHPFARSWTDDTVSRRAIQIVFNIAQGDREHILAGGQCLERIEKVGSCSLSEECPVKVIRSVADNQLGYLALYSPGGLMCPHDLNEAVAISNKISFIKKVMLTTGVYVSTDELEARAHSHNISPAAFLG